MAGRGRNATLPAWMTAEASGADPGPSGGNDGHPPIATHDDGAKFEDSNMPVPNNGAFSSVEEKPPSSRDRSRSRDKSRRKSKSRSRDRRRGGSRDRDRDRGRDRDRDRDRGDRDRGKDRDRGRDRDRSRDRGRDRERGRDRDMHGRDRDRGRDGSRDRGRDSSRGDDRPDKGCSANRIWQPRGSKPSNFDVRPPDGVELPPIGVEQTPTGVPNSYFSYSNNPNSSQTAQKQSAYENNDMLTRHARRVYAGGMPPGVSEQDILDFFNHTVLKALGPNAGMYPQGVVKKVYQNAEKCYAFIEFPTVELTTACMQLDGIKFEHPTGATVVRIRRPNDYKPELLPPSDAPVPQLELDGIVGAGSGGGSGGNGPGKIFIGGLPYNLQDEQIMELLAAFGTIKAFHQVRDPGSVTSKGYAFCQYEDPARSEMAIQGLNGLKLGEKTLSVRPQVSNSVSSTAPPPPAQTNPLLAGLQLGGISVSGGAPLPPQANPYGAYGGAPPPPMNALATQQSTRVLKLSNMVSFEELQDDGEYDDIIDDIRQECSEHGQVGRVLSPRTKDGFTPSQSGCFVYVQFGTRDMARSAAMALNGRKFADKTVVVEFYDEMHFDNSIFQ